MTAYSITNHERNTYANIPKSEHFPFPSQGLPRNWYCHTICHKLQQFNCCNTDKITVLHKVIFACVLGSYKMCVCERERQRYSNTANVRILLEH